MSWWDTAVEWGSNLFSSDTSSSSKSVWSSILSGVGSFAGDYVKSKDTEKTLANNLEAQRQKGLEDRRTMAYAADLDDFYKQEEKRRKRTSLEGYTTYNTNPMAKAAVTPAIDVPKKPKPEDYHNG